MNNTLTITLPAWRGKHPCVHKRISLFLQIQIRASDGVPKCCSVRESSPSAFIFQTSLALLVMHTMLRAVHKSSLTHWPWATGLPSAAKAPQLERALFVLYCIVLYSTLFYGAGHPSPRFLKTGLLTGKWLLPQWKRHVLFFVYIFWTTLCTGNNNCIYCTDPWTVSFMIWWGMTEVSQRVATLASELVFAARNGGICTSSAWHTQVWLHTHCVLKITSENNKNKLKLFWKGSFSQW